VDYLYSLYDALVSINVPNDKARAVVDAMERDMGTTLATKADLDLLQNATKADLEHLQQATKADLALLQQTTTADLQLLRREILQELALTRKDMEILGTTVTVRLGSILVLGLGVLFAALALTG
jgi:hypothetical protein